MKKHKHRTLAQTPHTNCQHGGGRVRILGLFTATGAEHLAVIDHELHCSQIIQMWDHLSAKTLANWEMIPPKQLIYNRMLENEKNQGVVMAHSKSRPQAHWNAVVALHKQMPANLNELKQRCELV